MKNFTNTHLALLTSVFILIGVVYSFIAEEPIYKLTSFYQNATIIVSIISLGIHFNAFKENKENKEKKTLILFSLAVPVAVIIYFTAGLIYWFNRGY